MIHIILGTKAQLIKMVPIMLTLRDRGAAYNFISTGQHRDTVNEMLDEFGLKRPDVVLYDGPDIVSVISMFFWALRILGKVLFRRKRIYFGDENGIVLVHGDTFSTLIGAISGRLAGMKVGHVESGLRSFNLFKPFPEEIVRLLTFRLSHILFCPGNWAMSNVKNLSTKAVDTGRNTMADTMAASLQLDGRTDHVPSRSYALVSIHRYENIFRPEALARIVWIIRRIAESHYLLFILHKPTEKRLRSSGLYSALTEDENIELRQRYTYRDFLTLQERAQFVVTDGGSMQEESSYLGLPCLLLRDATERREGLGENVILSGFDLGLIDDFVINYQRFSRPSNLDDTLAASRLIVDRLTPFILHSARGQKRFYN